MKINNPHLFPDRKISETLIDFAQPIVTMIDEHTNEEDIRSGFMIAVTVWNAHVFDTVHGDQSYLAQLRERLQGDQGVHPLIETLIRRKREQFADDMRAIGDCTVTWRSGDLHVWAEARDPYTSTDC